MGIDRRAADAAALLGDARRDHRAISGLPAPCRPLDIDQAYAVQRAFVERLIHDEGGQAVGYKIGCTNSVAQDLLGVAEPFYGRILTSSVATTSPPRRRGRPTG